MFVLLQHGIFRAGKKTKKISNIISKIPKGQIPSGGKQVWDNEALDLPKDLPATTSTKAVQIKYTMTVRAYSGQAKAGVKAENIKGLTTNIK